MLPMTIDRGTVSLLQTGGTGRATGSYFLRDQLGADRPSHLRLVVDPNHNSAGVTVSRTRQYARRPRVTGLRCYLLLY